MSPDQSFADELVEQIPALRAFARSLSKSDAVADDLVQEALCKAWAFRDKYQPGTKLLAWLFTILRNQFYSEKRKDRRLVADPDGIFIANAVTPPNQEGAANFSQFAAAFQQLSTQHREALFLIIACGMSYEEAGAVCDCPPGTMKSRVNRARSALGEYLDDWRDVGPDAIALAVQAARDLEQNHLAA